MARRMRLRLGGVAVHLIQRGVDGEACFLTDRDRACYLAELGALAPRHGCALHAYVLMTNNVHLLVTPDEAAGLSKLMQRLGRRHVRWFNEVHGRRGTLWEGRFRSCIAEDEGYVLACNRSIECNPVHAGMVADPLDYPWSSHAAHARGPSSPMLTPHPQMLSLGAEPGARRVAYRALFDETLDADLLDADLLGATRDATNGNYVLGSARFRDRIAETLGLRVSRGRPGRRRKGATG